METLNFSATMSLTHAPVLSYPVDGERNYDFTPPEEAGIQRKCSRTEGSHSRRSDHYQGSGELTCELVLLGHWS